MGKIIAFLYGLASYLVFFGTILYAIGFVTGLVVPKTIDTGAAGSMGEALIVNLLLMSLFAVQHSVMARKQFKEWWTQYVPKSVERSTYVLFASLALVLLFWQWQAMPAVVWQVTNPQMAGALTGISMIGWVLVFTSTFLINHFELFGLHQVVNNLAGRAWMAAFKTPVFIKSCAPDLPWFHHRVLGRPGHDRRAPPVRGGDDGVYFRRYLSGRARSGRNVRRRIPALP